MRRRQVLDLRLEVRVFVRVSCVCTAQAGTGTRTRTRARAVFKKLQRSPAHNTHTATNSIQATRYDTVDIHTSVGGRLRAHLRRY